MQFAVTMRSTSMEVYVNGAPVTEFKKIGWVLNVPGGTQKWQVTQVDS
jgi:hypothetical protein